MKACKARKRMKAHKSLKRMKAHKARKKRRTRKNKGTKASRHVRPKKVVLFRKLGGENFFITHAPAWSNVYQNMYY